MEREKILEINNMKISFTQYQKGIQQTELPVIKDLSVTIHAGEMVAVVGSPVRAKVCWHMESWGFCHIMLKWVEKSILRRAADKKTLGKLRGKEIVLVPQSTSYLDPLMKGGRRSAKEKRTKKRRNIWILFLNNILWIKRFRNSIRLNFPGESPGRIIISTALIENPKLVIADEPTPGLDPKLAKRAMEHFRQLADMGAAVLVITHDLELALETADRVQVFYAGYQSKMRQWMILMRKKLFDIHIPEHSGVRCRSTVFNILTGYSLM